MSKYIEIFEYMKTCPLLAELRCIGAPEEPGIKVVVPLSSSEQAQYQEKIDSTGCYECEIIPKSSVYEDFQINCYYTLDTNDSSSPEENINVKNLTEVQEICDWITEQNNINNLPDITDKKIVSIECSPVVPQIKEIKTQENIIVYFIIVRIRYLNTIKRQTVTFD